jgi:hypothetical protein
VEVLAENRALWEQLYKQQATAAGGW